MRSSKLPANRAPILHPDFIALRTQLRNASASLSLAAAAVVNLSRQASARQLSAFQEALAASLELRERREGYVHPQHPITEQRGRHPRCRTSRVTLSATELGGNIPRGASLGMEYNTFGPLVSEFDRWDSDRQVIFVNTLLNRMAQAQLVQIDETVQKYLKKDFVTMLPVELAWKILSFLDGPSLCAAEEVCRAWRCVVSTGDAWRSLCIANDAEVPPPTFLTQTPNPRQDGHMSAWQESHVNPSNLPFRARSVDWKRRFALEYTSERNWRCGRYRIAHKLPGESGGVYCVQYDDCYLVSGHRDCSIRVWDLRAITVVHRCEGHTGSVLCLQFDREKIISGSSDGTIRVWAFDDTRTIAILPDHKQPVLHLRFRGETLVTCSKDRNIFVWDISDINNIRHRHVLCGHSAAVNAVDFNDTVIVSASGDRSLKVWNINNGQCLRTLEGHSRGIACINMHGNRVVSGSSDHDIRVWDWTTGECVHRLQGHSSLVRCIRYDGKFIVSGSYDRSIKVWDAKTFKCLHTFLEHNHRVFRIQFDRSTMVSSSQDDNILIWDFRDDVQGGGGGGEPADKSGNAAGNSGPMNGGVVDAGDVGGSDAMQVDP